MQTLAARLEGTLVSWDDTRGFGFIESAGQPAPVFLHAKFLRDRRLRPKPGDRMVFALATGRDGGPAAADAEILGAPAPRPAQKPVPAAATLIDISRLPAALAILAGAVLAHALGRAPAWLPALYVVMSLGSGLAYWLDKTYAIEGRSRVRENSLHLADAFFGIAGGLFAQHVFRHKTRKRQFRYITRLIWLAHAAFLAAIIGGLIHFN